MTHDQTIRNLLATALVTLAASSAFAQSAVNWNSVAKSGEANPRPWCGQWWGHRNNGIAVNNSNGTGFADAMSPAEKLDKLVGRSMSASDRQSFDKVLSCALDSWSECQTMSGTDRVKCTQDNDKRTAWQKCWGGYTPKNAFTWEVMRHGKGAYGWDTWWGHCNAWGAAAVLYSEPIRPVPMGGMTFTVADVKGLLTESMMDVDLAADGWFGCRYDGPDRTRTTPGQCDTAEDAYNDVTPRELLDAFSKHIGVNHHGVVIDRHTEWEVWNQPLWKYAITDCRTTDGADPCGDDETKTTCNVSFTWAEDGVGYDEVCTPPNGYTTRTLAFSICVRKADGIINRERSRQRWEVSDDVERSERWPDFIWVPANIGNAPESANPFVVRHFDKIEQLQRASAGEPGQPPTPARTRQFPMRVVSKAIPDNDPRGTNAVVNAPSARIKSAAVCVDIDHTYPGDLVVTLIGPNRRKDILWKRQTGSDDGLKDCAGTTAFQNMDARGLWRLLVQDLDAGDTGTLNSAVLKLTQ